MANKWNTDIYRLGFGCMRFPTGKDGKIDREKATAMVDYAVSSGVNYFDTAYGYHDGESQRYIGEALARYPRDSYYLANKLPIWNIKERADVERLLQEQLEVCGVEYFDHYLVHCLDENRMDTFRDCGIHSQLVEKKRNGLIHNLGFSYHGNYEAFCELVENYEWDFVQIQINYLDVEFLEAGKLYQKLRDAGIPCIVMEPVRGGFLANPPEEALAEIKSYDGGKYTPAQWAFRWCMDLEGVPVILSGMTTMEQLQENLETFRNPAPLSPGDQDMLGRVREIVLSLKSIPCTECAYCMDCPYGVNIPGVFKVYNNHRLFKNDFDAHSSYGKLVEENHGANLCVACGKCAPMCPQSIPIPKRMSEVHEYLSAIQV